MCLHAKVKAAQSYPERQWSELHLYVLQPSLGLGCATHDSDYHCPLPRQRSDHSYRSLRLKKGRGLASFRPKLLHWLYDESGLGLRARPETEACRHRTKLVYFESRLLHLFATSMYFLRI